MVGLVSHARNSTRDHGEALAIDSRGNTRPVPAIKKDDIRQLVQESAGGELADMHNAAKPTKSIASRRTVEKESTQDTLKVLLAGIKMLCQDLENGPEAVELGEIASAVFNLQSEGFQQEHKLLGASVHRATGTAYELLANQSKFLCYCCWKLGNPVKIGWRKKKECDTNDALHCIVDVY